MNPTVPKNPSAPSSGAMFGYSLVNDLRHLASSLHYITGELWSLLQAMPKPGHRVGDSYGALWDKMPNPFPPRAYGKPSFLFFRWNEINFMSLW
jgi:hypothetical protein